MGNPTTYRNMTATWEKGRQLKSLTNGVNKFAFTYDTFGVRNSKTVETPNSKQTTEYIYDGGKLLRQTGNETIDFIYGQDGIMGIKVLDSSNVANRYLFRKNLFGDVTEIYSNSGELVGKYSYTAFGECAIELDTNGIASLNPIRYRGYYFDGETNLYYLKSRYYDAEIGRFITIDDTSYLDPDTINGLNLYAYCGNNPVMRVDPDGNAWWHWLIGIAMVAATTLLMVVTAGTAAAVLGIGAGIAQGMMIGTGIATATAGVVNLITQASNGVVEFDLGSLMGDMIINGLFGMATGGLGAAISALSPIATSGIKTLVHMGLQAGANAVLSSAAYIIQSAVSGNDMTLYGFSSSIISGFISGALYFISPLKTFVLSCGLTISSFFEDFLDIIKKSFIKKESNI